MPERVTAVAHPNVALVKYWGKRGGDGNVPATPSLSITLGGLTTRTTVTTDAQANTDRVVLNGVDVHDAKIDACLGRLKAMRKHAPALLVETNNDFPTAAGLASSASGFAALVTAVNALLELDLDAHGIAEQARHASASAARSLLGGFVTLEATEPAQLCSADAWPITCVVAVCEEGHKSISSTEGMTRSKQTSPFFADWLALARRDFDAAKHAIGNRDFDALGTIAEANCLAMHAVMLATRPALIYWNATTVAVMHAVQALRASGTPVYFTIDAGPQVKAICLPHAGPKVASALAEVPGVVRTIQSALGSGVFIDQQS